MGLGFLVSLRQFLSVPPKLIHHSFVKIIHKKKGLLKVAFWSEKIHTLTTCRNHRFEIDIESKWVYSHIKLRFIISCILF